jgi:hypothetical protein
VNHWEQALEQEAARIAIMRALHFTVAARNIRRAVALGVSSRHEAELVLVGVGYDDGEVKCVLGDAPSLSLDALEQVQIRAALVTLREQRDGGAARFARKVLGLTREELGVALGYTDEAVERWEDGSDDVPPAVVERLIEMLSDEVSAEEERQAIVGSFKVGGSYAEHLGAPAGCSCTWHVQPTFVGAPVVHRGRGMMPCPVHADADDAPLVRDTSTPEKREFWEQVKKSADVVRDAPDWMKAGINISETHFVTHRGPARFIADFGDIDEPSVGDVDGYGRRG